MKRAAFRGNQTCGGSTGQGGFESSMWTRQPQPQQSWGGEEEGGLSNEVNHLTATVLCGGVTFGDTTRRLCLPQLAFNSLQL